MTTFVLVPGFWLGAWAWREVATELRAAGHEVYPLTLTGLADRSHLAGPGIDLDTHTADIVRLIEAEELRDVVLVGHSGGGMPVAQAADRIPDRIARVVYVDSGPLPNGTSQFDINPPEEQDRLRALIGDGHLLPPPAWEPADDPKNLAGLDADAVDLLRRRATPQPLRTATDPVRRTGGGAPAPDPGGHPAIRNGRTAPSRPDLAVPTALVTCTFPVEVAREMIAQRHPFFALLAGADLYPLPTGHWPMFSEPKRLAEILDSIGRNTNS
jgi:pimeloyl-ACP methyl ester carboxylesterase